MEATYGRVEHDESAADAAVALRASHAADIVDGVKTRVAGVAAFVVGAFGLFTVAVFVLYYS